MRERMLLVAMGWMVGCGTAAPDHTAPLPEEAAAALATEEISLPGWPTISVVVETEASRQQLALVRESFASLPADSEQNVRAWRAWSDAQQGTMREILRLAEQPGSGSDRIFRLALLAVHTESLLRAVAEGRTQESVGERGARRRAGRDTLLRACTTRAEVNAALLPWSQHCEALIAYWQAWEAWRAGPVWPDGCEDSSGPIRETTDESSLGRPAVYFTWSSTSHWSPQDERTLLRAARDATRERLGDVDVLPESEVEAAREAHAAMRGSDGQMCAWPPRVGTLLARRHPRLWVATITAVPPIGADTVSHLAISFSAVSLEAPKECPPD